MRSALSIFEVRESLETNLPWQFTGNLFSVHVHLIPQGIITQYLPIPATPLPPTHPVESEGLLNTLTGEVCIYIVVRCVFSSHFS